VSIGAVVQSISHAKDTKVTKTEIRTRNSGPPPLCSDATSFLGPFCEWLGNSDRTRHTHRMITSLLAGRNVNVSSQSSWPLCPCCARWIWATASLRR